MAILAFLFSFRGTAGRGAALTVLALALALDTALLMLADQFPHQLRLAYPLVALSMVALLAVSARRLHQAGQSGRWALATLLPVVGFGAAALIALLPQRRTRLYAHNGARAAGYGLMAVLLAWGLWRLWFTPLWVVWLDMQPSLWVGDYVLLRAQIARDDLAPGDVLAIWTGDSHPKLMRLIAQGGDKVALRGGQVWLNGQPLRQLPQGDFAQVMQPLGPLALRPKCGAGLVGDGAICRNSMAREIGPGGRSYLVLDRILGDQGDDRAEIAVPPGMLYLLGDNRDDSLDSRYDAMVGGLGLVAPSRVLGRVDRIVLSSPAAHWLQFWTWRWGRLWQRVE